MECELSLEQTLDPAGGTRVALMFRIQDDPEICTRQDCILSDDESTRSEVVALTSIEDKSWLTLLHELPRSSLGLGLPSCIHIHSSLWTIRRWRPRCFDSMFVPRVWPNASLDVWFGVSCSPRRRGVDEGFDGRLFCSGLQSVNSTVDDTRNASVRIEMADDRSNMSNSRDT